MHISVFKEILTKLDKCELAKLASGTQGMEICWKSSYHLPDYPIDGNT